MSQTILVKVHGATKTIAEHTVVTKDGQPTIIKAQNRVNYELLDPTRGTAPDHIVAKRVGKDLHISLEKEGKDTDIIIEDYYDNKEANLIGIAEDGQYHYYIPDTGEMVDYVTELAAGDIEGHALGGETEALLAPWWTTAGTTGGSILPWLAGAAAVVGVAAAAGGGDDKKGAAADTVAPTEPTVTSVTQDKIVGKAEPNSTVALKDENDNVIGTATADGEGNFTIDPVQPISKGTYTVTATDKAGNVSKPTSVAVADAAPKLVEPTPVEVKDPTKLTDDEKQAVINAIKEANPQLPADAEITVADNGDVSVKVPGKDEATLPNDKTVIGEAPTLADPANVPVEDPSKLTADEKQKVIDAVKAANPDLTDDQITVADNGEVTVTVPGKKPASLEPKDTVTVAPTDTSAPKLVEPTPVEVKDPTKLTDDEKQAVINAIKEANPQLPADAEITVADNGDVSVKVPGKDEATLPNDKTVIGEAPTLADPANVPVEDPSKLTADEKQKVIDAVKAANPDLTDDQITVADNGEVTVTVPGKKPASLEPKDTVTVAPTDTSAPKLVEPTPVEVKDPTKLTDDEKQAVINAIKEANPQLPADAEITVADNGDVSVKVPGKDEATLPNDKTVIGEAPTLADPANVPVEDPSKLTADEKQKVIDAVKAANPDLTDDQITVADNGEVTVTVPGKKPASLEPKDTVTVAPTDTSAPKLVEPTPVEVKDPTKLTDDEKQAVINAIKEANPQLPADAEITVADNGDVSVKVPGKDEATLPNDKTVIGEAPTLADPANVPVEDPSKLTADEKQKVIDAVKAANPDLTDDQITVADNGEVTVTVPGKKPASLEPKDTVTVAPTDTSAPKLVEPTPVEVKDPTKLTDDEKQAVINAIKEANPQLPADAEITVADNGDVSVKVPGKDEATLPNDKTVIGEAPTLADPANVPVEDPSKLTADEKQKVIDAVKAANPDLTDDQITVADNGEVTVTVPGKKPASLEPKDTVTVAPTDTSAPKLVEPTPVEVKDPTKLTDDEKQAVINAIKEANPQLPADAEITVADNGDVSVKVPGKDEATLPNDKTVIGEAPTLADPANVPVEDPSKLTADEKQKVIDAVKAANPDLTDDQITVADNGEVTVTVPGKKPASLEPKDTVEVADTTPAEDNTLAVNPPETPVDVKDPAKLTDEEKAKVAEAVKQANPDLPQDAVVTVADNGEVTVTTPDGKTGSVPAEDAVKAATPAEDNTLAVNPPETPVDVKDPAKLTDEEKAKVAEAVKQANPDLPQDAVVTVADNGEVTVTTPDGKTGSVPAEDAVKAATPAEDNTLAVNPPETPVDVKDPAKLTDEEKAKVAEAVKQANPDLPQDAVVTVADNGEVTVTTPDGKTGSVPAEDAVKAATPAEDNTLAVNPPETPVDVKDPAKLTDEEKAKVAEAVKQANPDLPQDAVVTVADNGEVTVTTPDGKTGSVPAEDAVKAATPAEDNTLAVNPPETPVDVKDPAKLTDEEKAKVAEAVKQANPDLPQDAVVTVADNGEVTVTTPDGKTGSVPAEDAVKAATPAEDNTLAVNPPETPVDVKDPAKLTDEEKAKVAEAVKQANPDLPQDAVVTVADNGEVTVTTPDGKTGSVPAEDAVKAATPAEDNTLAVNPPETPVDVKDPAKLTDEEKAKVAEAVKQANPDLPQDAVVTVADNGEVTVTTPDGKTGSVPAEDAVKAATPAEDNTLAVNPPETPVDVKDPAKLTDEEKAKVAEAVKQANPDLPQDAVVTVADNGEVTVTTPDGKTGSVPAEDAVKAATPAEDNTLAVNPPETPVDVKDPAKLTDEEKAKVAEAVKQANPDLPQDAVVTVADNGEVTVTTPDGKTGSVPAEDAVKAATPAEDNTLAVNPPETPVDVKDPAKLTDEEKAKVAEAVKQANPDLPQDAVVTVADNGEVTVTTPDGKTGSVPAEDAVKAATPAEDNTLAVNPPETPVDVKDPAKLTDEEKAKVAEAVKQANPDLPQDAVVTVADNGEVTVTTPDGKTGSVPAEEAVKAATPAEDNTLAVNPPETPVDVKDPAKLTDEEKAKVAEAVKQANPDLPQDAVVTVADNGEVTVTTPDGKTGSVPAEDAVKAATPAEDNTLAVNPPETPVDVKDPAKLTDEEKAKVAEAVKQANPDLPQDAVVTVADNGEVTVTTPDGKTGSVPAEDAVKAATPAEDNTLAVNPPETPVDVKDPAKLTDEEKAKVAEAVKQANPDLPQDAVVTVADNGEVTVTTPDGKTGSVPAEDAVKAATPAEDNTLAVNPPETPVDVKDPAKLTDEEKAKVAEAVKQANPDLPQDAVVTVADNGEVTVTTPDGKTGSVPAEDAVKAATPAEDNTLAVNPPETPVDVKDPAKLTDEEKAKVAEAVKQANPDLPQDAVVTVADNGEVTVTTPDGKTGSVPAEDAVKAATPVEQPQPTDPVDEPIITEGAAPKIKPGADNDKMVIKYHDETGEFMHNEAHEKSIANSVERTITVTKQPDGTWKMELASDHVQTGNLVDGHTVKTVTNRAGTTETQATYIYDKDGNAVKEPIVFNPATGEVSFPASEVRGGSNIVTTVSRGAESLEKTTPVAIDNVDATDGQWNGATFNVANNNLEIDVDGARNLALEWTDKDGNTHYKYFHKTNPTGTQTTGIIDIDANKDGVQNTSDGNLWYEYNPIHTGPATENYKRDENGEFVPLTNHGFTNVLDGANSTFTIPLSELQEGSTVKAYKVNAIFTNRDVLAGESAPISAPTTPTDPVDTIDVIANEGGSVTIVPGADNEKIVVTYYDETGSVRGVEGMAGKTHTFNEVTTDDASADDAEPVKVTVGANKQVTVTLVKQNGAWVEEGKSSLPNGFSMDGDNIKIAHNSIMGDTEISVSATNSTTAEAATDTGKVLVDAPTNDDRKVHFQKFGELSAEAQAYYNTYAGDLYKGFTADSYVIFDGTDINAGKVHNAYAVETANGTKYYVMEKDIWYVADENLNSTGKEVNGSDDTFLVHHDTFIFKDSTLGTLPEGSTVRVWGINKDKGGNWELHDSYIVPRGVDQPLITPNEDGSVTIKSGANNDKLVVTFFDETNSGYTRNFTDLGSEGYNGDVIPLKMVSDAREGGSKNGATTFDTLMQASDQITMTLVKGDSGWVIENVMSSGKGDITEATRQGSGNIIVRNIENGADGLSFTLAPDSVMGNTKVNATGYLGTQQQAAEEKIAKVDEPTVKPKAYIETVGEMSQEMQDHLTPEIRADYYITDKSMVINPEKLEPSSEAHKNERYYSFKVVYTDLSGKQDSFFLVNDNGWKMSYKGNVVTLGSLEGAAQGFYVYNDLIVLPRSLSNTFKEGENIYLLTVDKDKAGAMQFLDSYVANEPVVSPIQNYRLTYKGTKPNHLTDNDYMPQDLDGNREFIGTYFHNGAEGRTRQGQNWLNDFTENSQPGDEGMIIDLKNDGHSTAVTWVYEPYLRALGKDQPLFIRGDGNDGVDLGNTNRTTGWNVDGYTSGRTSYNLGNWTKTGKTLEVTSPDINNKRISTTYDEYTSTDGYTVYIDNTMIVY